MNSVSRPPTVQRPSGWPVTLILLGLGCWLMAVCWHEWLCDGLLAASFDAEGGRRWLIRRLGGKLSGNPLGSTARVPFQNVLISNSIFTLIWWLGGAAVLARRCRVSFHRSLLGWGYVSSIWWLVAASWTLCRTVALAIGWESGYLFISHIPEMWLSFASAGWMTSFVCRYLRGSDHRWQHQEVSVSGGQGSDRASSDASSSSSRDKDLNESPLAPVLRGEESGVRGDRASPSTLTSSSVQQPQSTGARGDSFLDNVTSSLDAAQSPISFDARGSAGASPSQDELIADPNRTRCLVISPSIWRIPASVWLGMAAYTIIFGMLNTLLYNNLLVPHGDSAMYEEHLWNLLHGKGFRSFIDKGLFLGEHIQVIHLGLIPIYILWPSHVLLEWCQSLGLALGAIPVYRMAVRATQSRWQAACLACAYLLYVPMQRLDISIDFKTFRPEAFGIPLLLAALDALDARRWKSFGVWLFAALMVKEDYALIIGPLGLWLAIDQFRTANSSSSRWLRLWPGLLLAGGAVLYLWWALKIAIPYFKGGHEVHFAKYYDRYGQSMNEIVVNMLLHPSWLLTDLVTVENSLFAAALCLSLALLPLLSPGRLAVGIPLFVALCLNQIARNTQHHFHAPLVAIVFWSASHGLSNVNRIADCWQRYRTRFTFERNRSTSTAQHSLHSPGATGFASALRAFMSCCIGNASGSCQTKQTEFPVIQSISLNPAGCVAIMTLFASSGFHFWHSHSPGGLPFWDSMSAARRSQKYTPSERATQFIHVINQIPPDRHVASTDFVHPRFNHHARSYDYSSYRPEVPADVEYLIIDATGPYTPPNYSPQDVPEYQQHPDRWELLPDQTGGYYFVFKRR